MNIVVPFCCLTVVQCIPYQLMLFIFYFFIIYLFIICFVYLFYFIFWCRWIKRNSFHQIKTLLKKSCQRRLKTLQICSCWWSSNTATDKGTAYRTQSICSSELLQNWIFMIQETSLKGRSRELYPWISIYRIRVSLKSSHQNFITSQKSVIMAIVWNRQ